MRTPSWKTPLAIAGVMASVPLAALAATSPGHALGILLFAGTALFVITAGPGPIVLVMTAAAVIHPTAWPPLGALWGGTFHYGDATLLVVCATALLRCTSAPRAPVLKVLTAFLLFGVVRSATAYGLDNTLSFLRVMEPVIAGAVVSLSLPRDFDLWRWARWGLLGALATVPLFGNTMDRWYGLPGGSNEVALVAAVLLVIGAAEPNKFARTLFVASGLVGLFGARGIGAAAGALAGLAVLALGRSKRVQGVGAKHGINLLVFACAVTSAVMLIPVIRPDMHLTLQIHTLQAESFWGAFEATNPMVGSGWSQVDPTALTDTYRYTHLEGLHNVYLDIAVYLGIIGSGMFLMLLWHTWRPRDLVTRAVLVATVVWFNTTGAFPCAGWGVLGMAVAASACRTPGFGREESTTYSGVRTSAFGALTGGIVATRTRSTRNQQAVLNASRHKEPHAKANVMRSGPAQS